MSNEQNTNPLDKITAILKVSTDILFVRNPVSTGMGVFFGAVLHGLIGLFGPLIEQIKSINIDSLNIIHYICFGIFGFNVPNWWKRHEISPSISKALELIDSLEKSGKLTKAVAATERKKLCLTAANSARMSALERQGAKK